MLEAVNISHTFDYLLFEDVNLKINPKDKIAIIGKSGSGKSTLLHILAALLKPQKGNVFYNGFDIYSLKEKDLINIRRYEFGIIFQSHYLFNTFTALENIQTLSGGQQQRVSLARVLVKKPKIIFADEPTGNLDKTNAYEVMQILSEYCEENNASLITVTHDNELEEFFDKIYKLKDKRLSVWK